MATFQKERIDYIRLESSGKVALRPTRTKFDQIYRTASGVDWDSKKSELTAKGSGVSPLHEAFSRIIRSIESEYGIRLAVTFLTKWESFDEKVRSELAHSIANDGSDLIYPGAAEISSEGQEFVLRLFDFRRFEDDSSVLFKLQAKHSYFEIRNFDFYSGEDYFAGFLPNLKLIYASLSGTVELKPTYENDTIKFEADGRGHISIQVRAEIHNGTSDSAGLTIEVDQSFLPSFISDLEIAYRALGYSNENFS